MVVFRRVPSVNERSTILVFRAGCPDRIMMIPTSTPLDWALPKLHKQVKIRTARLIYVTPGSDSAGPYLGAACLI